MFEAVFATDCPFTSFFLDTRAGRKSFVRTASRIEHAAKNYNRANNYSPNNPNYIEYKHIEIFEEPDEYGCVAYMSFRTVDNDPWPVAIMQY